jgi:hypothetical protein
METRQKILIYGNSLALSCIQASLRTCPSFDVIAPNPTADQAELLAPPPDVIIFDMGAVQSEFLLAQMQSLPGLLLIGIDPESHEVLLTGQAAHSISLDQIAQILRSRDG